MILQAQILFYLTLLINSVSADTINGCVASSIKTDIDGFVGSIYYYPWASDSFAENQVDFTSSAYQEGGYASNSTIVTENDGHSRTKPATVVNNVRITNLT